MGDITADYVQVFCYAILAAIGTIVWTMLDTKRDNYARLHDALRVLLRYSLAYVLIGYGAAKVIPVQFPAPFERLVEPYGASTPRALLWTFMGYSYPYTVFSGLSEIVGGGLLLFRRTTTLGALVVIGVMSNVVMLNFSYDVPVKLFSLHLLAMAAFLLAPDLRRLLDVLLLQRAVPAIPVRPAGRGQVGRAARGALKTLVVSYIIITQVGGFWSSHRTMQARKTPLDGIYEVESFVRNRDTLPAVLSDSTRWRRVIVRNRFAIQHMDDAIHGFPFRFDPASSALILSGLGRAGPKADTATTHVLVYERKTPNTLMLRGLFGGDSLRVILRRVNLDSFALLRQPFRWALY